MPKFPRDLVKPFVRLGAAIAEKNFSRSDALHQLSRKLSARLRVIEIGNVHQLLRLLGQCVCDLGVCVSQTTHCNAGGEIQIATPAHAPNFASSAMRESQRKRSIRGPHVTLILLLNSGLVIPDNGRWWWNNFSHITTSVPTPASVKISRRTE